MRKLLILAGIFLLAAGPPMQASGWAAVDTKHKVKLVSGFATWNPKENMLRVMLLPFQPTAEQISWVEREPSADYQVVESPARPFVRLDIRFKEQAYKHINLSIWRADGKKSNVSVQGSKPTGKLELNGNFREGQPIQVKASGRSEQLRMSWDFKANCRVFVIQP